MRFRSVWVRFRSVGCGLGVYGFPAHSVVQTGYTTPTLRFSGYTTRDCATRSVYPLNCLVGVM